MTHRPSNHSGSFHSIGAHPMGIGLIALGLGGCHSAAPALHSPSGPGATNPGRLSAGGPGSVASGRLDARWLRTSRAPGGVQRGPWVGALRSGQGVQSAGTWIPGEVLLLGGRRTWIGNHGQGRIESVATPEPLRALTLVPTAQGPRLVGSSEKNIYVFDEPLGPPRIQLKTENWQCVELGSAPGKLVVFPRETCSSSWEPPWLVDLDTGETSPMEAPAPVTSMEFLDLLRGAAMFAPQGLHLTRDGGKTWIPVALPKEISTVQLTRTGTWISITDKYRIDFEHARAVRRSPASDPTLRHIELSGMDPLAAAAASGVRSGPHEALTLAQDRHLLRVDLNSGAVLARTELPGACNMAGGLGNTAWLSCNDEDATRVWSISRDIHQFDPTTPPDFVRKGKAYGRIEATATGLVFLSGPCTLEEKKDGADWCVRGRDGSFRTAGPGLPLIDGGMIVGDLTPTEDGPPSIELSAPGRATQRFALPVKGERVAPWNETRTDVRAFFKDGENQVSLVVQPLDGSAARKLALPGAVDGNLVGSTGLAFGELLRLSKDFGDHWTPLPAPAEFLQSSHPSLSEVGAASEETVLIGFESPRPPVVASAERSGSLPPPNAEAAPTPNTTIANIRCTDRGALESPEKTLLSRFGRCNEGNGGAWVCAELRDRTDPRSGSHSTELELAWWDPTAQGSTLKEWRGSTTMKAGEANPEVSVVLATRNSLVARVLTPKAGTLLRITPQGVETQPLEQTERGFPWDYFSVSDSPKITAWVQSGEIFLWPARGKARHMLSPGLGPNWPIWVLPTGPEDVLVAHPWTWPLQVFPYHSLPGSGNPAGPARQMPFTPPRDVSTVFPTVSKLNICTQESADWPTLDTSSDAHWSGARTSSISKAKWLTRVDTKTNQACIERARLTPQQEYSVVTMDFLNSTYAGKTTEGSWRKLDCQLEGWR